MTPPVRRRAREADPVVSARLQALAFADPYVFVHANDVLESEVAAFDPLRGPYEGQPPSEPPASYGGWVPEPPVSVVVPASPVGRRTAEPEAQPPPVRALPRAWVLALQQQLEPARNAVVALVVLGLVAVAVAGFFYLRAQPARTPTRLPASGSAAATVRAGAPSSAPVTLLVDVTGKVRRPGVVRLPGAARVGDAVRAAGGALPGTSLDSLNLAAKLTDGQLVAVGAPAPVAAVGGVGGAGGSAAAPVDLNTATVTDLTTLPGIGPVLAQRILDYRTAHGPFASVDGLHQVSGIGPSKFADLKDHVTV